MEYKSNITKLVKLLYMYTNIKEVYVNLNPVMSVLQVNYCSNTDLL